MFKVYSSSAGSGKTYTLTKEYLKLALHSNSETYFRQILAVTFTNAAANEMKERIMLMLRTFANASSADATEHPMLRDVVTELYPVTLEDPSLYAGAKELVSGRAQLVFRQILHRYSDFSVMTIDKFTQRLISSFTDELGIPFVFETQLDGTLLDEAVDRLLARIGQDGEEVLSDIVERYYREKAGEGKSWASLPSQIRETAGTLLSEESYIQMQRVADLQMNDWIEIRNQMRLFVRSKEEEIKTLAQKAFGFIQDAFLNDKDFYQGARGIYGYFRDRSEGKNLWTAPNSYVSSKTIGEENWYGAKTATLIKEKIESLRGELENLYHTIEKIRTAEIQKIILYGQLDKHLYNLSLLGEVRKEFDALLKQNNQVHISDFNRRILEIVSREPVPFIFERLGEKYNHILVDEFQDTSKLQFANLLPLIENALADGFFNLIVGDAKQSIYRFRGGDMDLILHLAQNQVMQLAPLLGNNNVHNQERLWSVDSHLEVNHLRTNRRSFREITQFNNEFFGFISESAGEEFALVRQVYDENFKQEIPDGVHEGGHVQMEFVDMHQVDDGFSETEPENDAMVERSVTIIEEQRALGFYWRDIAVLCRRKKEATALANALKTKGYPLISDDALSLSYSRSVHFIISFMEVLHTDQRLKRYEAAYLFHRVIRKENPTAAQQESLRNLCAQHGLDTFLSYFKEWGIELTAFRMRQLNVFELSEQLMQTFGLFKNKTENEYLFRFLDVVLEFGTRKSNHLGDFLQYWETSKHKLSITIPADTDALRITTIHKSKGLEYPVVIIPYANWKVTPDAKLGKMWVDMEYIDYGELTFSEKTNELFPIHKKLKTSQVSVVKDLDETLVAEQYQNEKTRTLVENLNLLYVAFTRPIQKLYVLAKREKNWDRSSLVSTWMHDFLSRPDFEPAYNEEQSQFILSQGNSQCLHAHAKNHSEALVIKEVISNDRSDSLRLRRMAERIFDIETFERKKDNLQKARYLLMRLRTIDGLSQTLGHFVREGILVVNETRVLKDLVLTLLENTSLAALYAENLEVQINKELLLPGGKMLHVDRLVLLPDETHVFMTFVAGSVSEQPASHLKRLIKVYQGENKKARGVLILLESGMVEWIGE